MQTRVFSTLVIISYCGNFSHWLNTCCWGSFTLFLNSVPLTSCSGFAFSHPVLLNFIFKRLGPPKDSDPYFCHPSYLLFPQVSYSARFEASEIKHQSRHRWETKREKEETVRKSKEKEEERKKGKKLVHQM